MARRGLDGLTPGARWLLEHLEKKFGRFDWVDGYRQEANTPKPKQTDHVTRRAIDLGFADGDWRRAEQVKEYMLQNHEWLGLEGFIWDGTQYGYESYGYSSWSNPKPQYWQPPSNWEELGYFDPYHRKHNHTVQKEGFVIPKDGGGEPVKGKTAAEVIDEFFAANYTHYGPYEPVGSVIVEEATGKIDVALAAALVEKESGGRNIFGCDWGSQWAGRSPWCNEPVTRSRLDALIADIEAGYGSNGVGLTQLTYPPYIQQAEDEGGAHIARNQCRVGFRLLRDLVLKLGYTPGLAAYNAGEGNWQLGVSNGYAGDLAYKHGLWKERLSGTVEPEKPEPEPEPGYLVIIGSRKKPLTKRQAERIVKARRDFGQAARAREIRMPRQTNAVRDETEKTWVYGEEPPAWVPATQPTTQENIERMKATALSEAQESPQKAESHGPNTQAPQGQETPLRPTRKVSAATAAMFATTIIVYVLNLYGVEVPPEVSAAITGLLGIVAAYLVPEGS